MKTCELEMETLRKQLHLIGNLVCEALRGCPSKLHTGPDDEERGEDSEEKSDSEVK